MNMIITGKRALLEKMVTETVGEGQCQPCGIDLTLKEAHEIASAGEIDFDNSKRRISESKKLEFSPEGSLHLKQGCYKIVYNEYVTVPLDACAFGFPRSSLLRCGADVHCAVWDPGYHGRSESLLVVNNSHGIVLHKNAKVMQLVFVRLESAAHEGYAGKYKGENKS
ncbi:MAG: deoxyuridine 5'-triphosphate nucleotidohydrolase [Candidatus Micrarchaeota archaeon]|nr:deoxyuridine 5'-triphosphate nucleotidohydrolase [Candidatus Micrarchaeota archaeon]